MALPLTVEELDLPELAVWLVIHPCALCGHRFSTPTETGHGELPLCRRCRPPAPGPARHAFERERGVDLRALAERYQRLFAIHLNRLSFEPEQVGQLRYQVAGTRPRQITELVGRVPCSRVVDAADCLWASCGDLALAEGLLRLSVNLSPFPPQRGRGLCV